MEGGHASIGPLYCAAVAHHHGTFTIVGFRLSITKLRLLRLLRVHVVRAIWQTSNFEIELPVFPVCSAVKKKQ